MSINQITQKSSQRVLVIGAGVVGLTTALCLLRNGLQVTVIAEKFSPGLTSNVAGALWEWPPAVCGHHRNEVSLERSKEWCMTSYEIFNKLAHNPETGVRMLTSVFFFKHLVEERPQDLSKMKEMKHKLDEFRHDSRLIEENDVNTQLGFKDAYSHLAPVVHTDIYLDWLLQEVKESGCKILKRKVSGSLLDQEEELKQEFKADAIVNCAGLGAREIAGDDEVYPLRGALIRVHNDGRHMPIINKALSVTLDERGNSQNMIYLVPRGNILLLGGLVEKDEWSTDINLENYNHVRQIRERCIEFLPVLKNAKIDTQEPVRVGLRPGRKSNVCLEHEKNTSIIHNYGQGGSGVTLSWGCAMEVAKIVKQLTASEVNIAVAA